MEELKVKGYFTEKTKKRNEEGNVLVFKWDGKRKSVIFYPKASFSPFFSTSPPSLPYPNSRSLSSMQTKWKTTGKEQKKTS